MPGRLFLTANAAQISAAVGVPVPEVAARRNMAPGEELLTVTADGAQNMRWGLIPVGRKNARGRPVMETIINARSETVFDKSAFEGVRRCVVPVNGWYEWTGETRKKTAWRIELKDGGVFCFAGIFDVWQAPGGQQVAQVATVTCAPNADVKPIHHRMGVILRGDQVFQWLQEDNAAPGLMNPLPEGLLQIEKATAVDWTAP